MSHWGSPTETPTGICSSDGSRGGESFTPVVRLADGRAVAAAESDIVSVQRPLQSRPRRQPAKLSRLAS